MADKIYSHQTHIFVKIFINGMSFFHQVHFNLYALKCKTSSFNLFHVPLRKRCLSSVVILKMGHGLETAFSRSESTPFLHGVFVESIDNQTLLPTLSPGLLTLIPKPRKDPLLTDYWRPIHLLNNNYKILA